DQIKKEQPILELENEKAVATIPSTAAGKVTKVHVKTGDKITVGQTLVSVEESRADAAPAAEKTAGAPKVKATPEKPGTPGKREEELPGQEESLEPKPGIAPAAAPSIRKLAHDLGIDLSRVRGSESGGRIVIADVRAYIH